MLEDLGMTTNDYNTGQTIFYLTFLFAELPSQLLSKWLGPDRWIPVQMVTWSVIAACQAFIKNKSGFFATRALLGLIEGGFIPDTILFLSFWYKSKELPIRLSYFWVTYEATSIVSAFLAFGFLHIRQSDGTGGWRYLFALEGLITGLIGIVAAVWMPPSPTQTAGRFRGKDGWFNEREEKIMVNRVLRDDPSKGTMHNRQAVTPKLLWQALKDYDMWVIYLLGLTWMIPNTPATSYVSLELKSLGFSTFHSNLLTIPAYVIFIINLLIWTWFSERFNQRLLLGVGAEIWALALLIALELLPADASTWARWVLLIMLIGMPYVHAIIVAITSRNAGSVRTRTVASAVYNMMVQASSIIGSNVSVAIGPSSFDSITDHRRSTVPRTSRTTALVTRSLLVSRCGVHSSSSSPSFIMFGATSECFPDNLGHVHELTSRYRQNAAIWDNMSSEERTRYVAENKDLGNKRYDMQQQCGMRKNTDITTESISAFCIRCLFVSFR